VFTNCSVAKWNNDGFSDPAKSTPPSP